MVAKPITVLSLNLSTKLASKIVEKKNSIEKLLLPLFVNDNELHQEGGIVPPYVEEQSCPGPLYQADYKWEGKRTKHRLQDAAREEKSHRYLQEGKCHGVDIRHNLQ